MDNELHPHKILGVTICSRHNFNDSSTKSPFKLRHRWTSTLIQNSVCDYFPVPKSKAIHVDKNKSHGLIFLQHSAKISGPWPWVCTAQKSLAIGSDFGITNWLGEHRSARTPMMHTLWSVFDEQGYYCYNRQEEYRSVSCEAIFFAKNNYNM